MDHKVSKDMISNGMTPSGEKTQADLGRIQYGSAPSPSKLMDAYKSMYDKKEEIKEHHKKDADGNTIPHEGEELNEFIGIALGGLSKVVGGMAGKAAIGAAGKTAAAGATKAAAAGATKAAAAGAGKAAAGAAGKTAMTTGAKVTGSGGQMLQGPAVKKGLAGAVDKFKKMDSFQKFQTYQMGKDALNTAGAAAQGVKGATTVRKKGTGTVSADVDLFDIVKGHLLDEGLSEEEIQDIMLTLTPDEILNEISVGKMGDYISAADKDIQKTAASIKKDGSVMSDDPRVKKMTNRAQGMAVAGTKIAKKMSPPRMEEYKGSGTPEQQAAMKAQVEVSKKVNRYGGKTPSGTTAVDAKKGIEDVRKSM